MSRAERFRVPLNSRCSRKCDAPASSGRSSLDAMAPSPKLGDVDQPIDAGKNAHEGAELGGLDHLAVEDLPHLGDPRVEDLVDHLASPVGALAPFGTDEHGAVVLDVDVRTGGGDDLVDPLPLGPDDLADLVHG